MNIKIKANMQIAIEMAKKALSENEVPIGAVIYDFKKRKIIAKSHNLTITNSNPTAHAEILAIEQACKIRNNNYLTDCEIYTTIEPCPMCAYAISLAKIKRLIFAASDFKSGGVENGPQIFKNKSCHYQPEIIAGVLSEEAGSLVKNFFQKKRI